MKQKGFTLIELLAVIVILAIIALIAIPTITNIVEEARKGAAKASALGYIDAVEKQIMINNMSPEKQSVSDGIYEISELTFVKVKGTAPSEGWVEIKKQKVTDYSFKINKYYINPVKDSNKIDVDKNGEIAPSKPAVIIDTKDVLSVYRGATLSLSAHKIKTDAPIVWSSDNMSRATVTSDGGVVTGVNVGEVVITASAGEVSDSVTINVVYPPYAYSSSALSKASDGSIFRPTDKNAFFRYSLTNGEIGSNVINTCVYSEEKQNELCIIKGINTATAVAQIKSFFEFNENTWTKSGDIWTSNDGSKTCTVISYGNGLSCTNGDITAAAYAEGIRVTRDEKSKFECSFGVYIVGDICKQV